jgi:hypothetical protein
VLGDDLGEELGPSVRIELEPLGVADGTTLGEALGVKLGPALGKLLGEELGAAVGATLGPQLGAALGRVLGDERGEELASILGDVLGPPLGMSLGPLLGDTLGPLLGDEVGAPVGKELGLLVDKELGITLGCALVGLLIGDLVIWPIVSKSMRPPVVDFVGELVGDLVLWLPVSTFIRVPAEAIVGELVVGTLVGTLVGDLVLWSPVPTLIRLPEVGVLVGLLVGDLLLWVPVTNLIKTLPADSVVGALVGLSIGETVLRPPASRLIIALFGSLLVGILVGFPLVEELRTSPLSVPRSIRTVFGLSRPEVGPKIEEFRGWTLVGSGLELDVVPDSRAILWSNSEYVVRSTAGFAVERIPSVAGATPTEETTGGGRLVSVLEGPSTGANSRLVLGFSRVSATGVELGSDELDDDSMSINKRLTEPLAISTELTMHMTVITDVDANIATTAIVSLVATERAVFAVAAFAMVLAPLKVEAPVERAAWTAIDSKADFILLDCTMVASSLVMYVLCSLDGRHAFAI